jgi:UDP-N-acetylmuramoylalanine--D-glutamate ligase
MDFDVVDSMEKAVALATEKAGTGDVVLLSPGAASFGLFLNEFDRGDKFRAAVKELD